MFKKSLMVMTMLGTIFYSVQAQEVKAQNQSVVSKPNLPLVLPTVKYQAAKPSSILPAPIAAPVSTPDANAQLAVVAEVGGLDEKTRQDNEVIRDLFSNLADGINTKDNEKVLTVVRDQFIVIPSNQELITGKKKVEDYFPKIVGGKYKFERTGFKIEPGVVVEISSSGDMAKVYGRGAEKYLLNEVEHNLTTRWTADVVKQGEDWKIASFHSGVNFTENSVLTSFEEFGWKIGFIGGLIGIVLGFILSLIITVVVKKK